MRTLLMKSRSYRFRNTLDDISSKNREGCNASKDKSQRMKSLALRPFRHGKSLSNSLINAMNSTCSSFPLIGNAQNLHLCLCEKVFRLGR